MALPIFAITLFVSAFLLFMVQPMIGKMILPKLGGTPQVWNTCCVFFQCALLAGYGYTHSVSSKLKLKQQLLFHGALLVLPLLVLLPFGGPFNIESWTPPAGTNPIPATLLILTIVVAVPFIVVATSAPLLQRWFASTGHPAAKDPYFLYGASNLGSMLALVSYPFVVEPFLAIRAQAWTWAIAYVFLAGLIAICAFLVAKAPPTVQLAGMGGPEAPPEPAPVPAEAPPPPPSTQIQPGPAPGAARTTGIRKGSKQRGKPSLARPLGKPASIAAVTAPLRPFEMSWGKRLRWVGLAAVPCSMMLGVTTYISTDISAIPLFWVVPLALYLLSFILVFIKWPVVWATPDSPPIPMPIQFIGLGLFLLNVVAFLFLGSGLTIGLLTLSIAAMFLLVLFGPLLFPGFHWKGVPHMIMVVLQPFGLLILTLILLTHAVSPIYRSTAICMLGFFLTAMVCHGELARDRPPTRWLTEFFLWMSVGGAVGGIFNAILAPILFVGPVEFPIALVVAGLLRPFWPGEPWSYSIMKSILPEQTIQSLDASGDELVRRLQAPAPGTEPAADVPPGRRAEPGFLVNLCLDFLLPAFVLILAMMLINKGSDPAGWNFKGGQKNPLFSFLKSFLGMEQRTAAGYVLPLANGIIYGIPLIFCLMFFSRPIRFGLTLGAVLLASGLYEAQHDSKLLAADRSYFGILRVREDEDRQDGGSRNTYLMHGTTHHGLNFQEPPAKRRRATTYYHRNGPVGVIMEKINWFPGPSNGDTYWADCRLTASVAGLGAANVGGTTLPLAQIVGACSEPAYACVGLGTGTMASYSRPFQHMTFYEIDEKIRNFSLGQFSNNNDQPYFNYIMDAKARGANIEIIMGDARLSLKNEDPSLAKMFPQREQYYRAIELDAFSSDAIPVHLITKEAIELYFEKLTHDGVLLVHTSNRHVNLVHPVTKVATEAVWYDWTDQEPDATGAMKPKRKVGLKYRVGKDGGGQERLEGHFASEYVMLARDEKYLPRSTQWDGRQEPVFVWYTPPPPDARIWTDDYSNMVGVLRWGFGSDYERPRPDNPPRGPEEPKK